jgi:2,3-bisphosphoglycerate-independent phosphoglycerate mutase
VSKLPSPIALIILDGFGIGKAGDTSNAIARAGTPHISLLSELYPNTALACSGEAVGLPEGQMGNSEVGHLNMGSGRIVYQELTRISKAIRDGDFFENPVLLDVVGKVKASGSALHLMGLVSDGGVHSHITHIYGLLELAKRQGLSRVYIHAFLDGRDVPPCSALGFLDDLEAKAAEIGVGRIASVSGRYYAMDRDKRWDRTCKAYAALVARQGEHAQSARAAVEAAYARGENDEFVLPTVVDSCSDCGIRAGDGLIFFNFRPDRGRQLSWAFADKDFDCFPRDYIPLAFATFTQYDEKLPVPAAYQPQYLKNTLGEVFGKAGLSQLRIAETEKYAHVTYFFNGGEEEPYPGEDRILIPSPKVATYDLKPEMSAIEVTDRVVAEIKTGKYDLIIMNYANGDMVGHTGFIDAAVKAVETVDACVGRVVDAIRARGGAACITADHGNADQMIDDNGEVLTAHTLNPVPFILVSEKYRGYGLRSGLLADIAPTVLELAGLTKPPEMTGQSLIIKP